jgi:Leucine-rich repeat (LRR) protein
VSNVGLADISDLKLDFSLLDNLEYLDLSHNRLQVLKASHFSYEIENRQLRYLILSHNQIQLVEMDSFVKLRQLIVLDIRQPFAS